MSSNTMFAVVVLGVAVCLTVVVGMSVRAVVEIVRIRAGKDRCSGGAA